MRENSYHFWRRWIRLPDHILNLGYQPMRTITRLRQPLLSVRQPAGTEATGDEPIQLCGLSICGSIACLSHLFMVCYICPRKHLRSASWCPVNLCQPPPPSRRHKHRHAHTNSNGLSHQHCQSCTPQSHEHTDVHTYQLGMRGCEELWCGAFLRRACATCFVALQFQSKTLHSSTHSLALAPCAPGRRSWHAEVPAVATLIVAISFDWLPAVIPCLLEVLFRLATVRPTYSIINVHCMTALLNRDVPRCLAMLFRSRSFDSVMCAYQSSSSLQDVKSYTLRVHRILQGAVL